MPGTEEPFTTALERRVGWCHCLFHNLALGCILILYGVAPLVLAATILYWVITSLIFDTNPGWCFNTVSNCEVLQVAHVFKRRICSDVFQYTFKLPNSPAEYRQTEAIRRENANCGVSGLVTAANATLQQGFYRCFSVTEFYAPSWSANEDCAKLIRRNNASLPSEDCKMLFPPTSVFDSTMNAILGLGAVIFCICPNYIIFWWRIVTDTPPPGYVGY